MGSGAYTNPDKAGTDKIINNNDTLRKVIMKDNKTAALRIPAFFIDAAFVVAALVGLLELLLFTNTIKESPAVELVMFVCVPVGFFVYWALNINLGKRIFKLVIVDELSEKKASIWQLFLRSILFCMLVSM